MPNDTTSVPDFYENQPVYEPQYSSICRREVSIKRHEKLYIMTKQRWSIGPYGLVLLCLAGMTANVFATEVSANNESSDRADLHLSHESSDSRANYCPDCKIYVSLMNHLAMNKKLPAANVTDEVYKYAIEQKSQNVTHEEIGKFVNVIIPILEHVTKDQHIICSFLTQTNCGIPFDGNNLAGSSSHHGSILTQIIVPIKQYVFIIKKLNLDLNLNPRLDSASAN